VVATIAYGGDEAPAAEKVSTFRENTTGFVPTFLFG